MKFLTIAALCALASFASSLKLDSHHHLQKKDKINENGKGPQNAPRGPPSTLPNGKVPKGSKPTRGGSNTDQTTVTSQTHHKNLKKYQDEDQSESFESSDSQSFDSEQSSSFGLSDLLLNDEQNTYNHRKGKPDGVGKPEGKGKPDGKGKPQNKGKHMQQDSEQVQESQSVSESYEDYEEQEQQHHRNRKHNKNDKLKGGKSQGKGKGKGKGKNKSKQEQSNADAVDNTDTSTTTQTAV